MLPLSGRGTADCYVCAVCSKHNPVVRSALECDEKVALDAVPAHSNTLCFRHSSVTLSLVSEEFAFASGAELDCCERGVCILAGDIVMAGRSLSYWI